MLEHVAIYVYYKLLRNNYAGYIYNAYPSTMCSKIAAPLYKDMENIIKLASYPAIHCFTKLMMLKCCYRGQLELKVEFNTSLIIHT